MNRETPSSALDRPTILRNAKMAELLHRPTSEQAIQAISYLSNITAEFEIDQGLKQRRRNARARASFEATIAALVCDLLIAQGNHEAEGFCFRSSNREEFSNTLAESRAYDAIRKAWEMLGFLEIANGFRGTDNFDGEVYHPNTPSYRWSTRLRATGKLLSILKNYQITPLSISSHFTRENSKANSIVLKARKTDRSNSGKSIKFTTNQHTEKLVSEVIEINNFLEGFSYNLAQKPSLYRVFNNGDCDNYTWNEGGRFYCSDGGYQSLSSEERKRITINNMETQEVDISACQLTLLHGLLGVDFDPTQDPYDIDSLPREAVKKIVNLTIGRRNIPSRAPTGFWSSIPKASNQNFKAIRDEVIQNLPILKQIETCEFGSTHLQFFESEIIKETMLTLFRLFETPVLPVHDSLITRKKDAELVIDILKKKFFEAVGVPPRITSN